MYMFCLNKGIRRINKAVSHSTMNKVIVLVKICEVDTKSQSLGLEK